MYKEWIQQAELKGHKI